MPHGPLVAVRPLDQRASPVFGHQPAVPGVREQHVIRAHRHRGAARPVPVARRIVPESRHVRSPATGRRRCVITMVGKKNHRHTRVSFDSSPPPRTRGRRSRRYRLVLLLLFFF